MSTKKIRDIDEKIKKIELEKIKLEKQYKNIIYQQKKLDSKQKRKIRTRNLIQKGALLEKYFELKNYSIDDTEKLLDQFSDFVKANKSNYFKEKYENDKQHHKTS